MNRVFLIIILGTLIATPLLAAAPGDMSVTAFLAKADNLKAKGFLALGSPEIALLQTEAKAAGAAYRKRIETERRQKAHAAQLSPCQNWREVR